MTNTIAPHIASMRLMARRANDVADEARELADEINIAYVKLVLDEEFPEHDLVIFARYDDVDDIQLIQALSRDASVNDIDLTEDDGPDLVSRQRDAALLAEALLNQIGGDARLLKHLDSGEHDHDGWTEYQLSLHDEGENPA